MVLCVERGIEQIRMVVSIKNSSFDDPAII
jgi:hypothetical protein